MKILIIGMGGIGSFLFHEIVECVKFNQIDLTTEFYLADSDSIEYKNLSYQRYSVLDVGKIKAKVISERYEDLAIITPLGRITQEAELKGYDLIICCADNNIIRELVFKSNIPFIDLRSEGRYIMAFQKGDLKADLETLDLKNTENGSCQKKYEYDKGLLQMGNKIVANIGVQMLLNYLRGELNSKILMRI